MDSRGSVLGPSEACLFEPCTWKKKKKEYAHAFIYVLSAEPTDVHQGRITSRTVQGEQSQDLDGLCPRVGFTYMYDGNSSYTAVFICFFGGNLYVKALT